MKDMKEVSDDKAVQSEKDKAAQPKDESGRTEDERTKEPQPRRSIVLKRADDPTVESNSRSIYGKGRERSRREGSPCRFF